MALSRFHTLTLAGILIVLLSTACAVPDSSRAKSGAARPADVIDQIKPMVESLYLKAKELEVIYLDLRSVANARAFLPDDRQLNNIQKSALYVQKALQTAFHQWEFLSIMEDVKPSAMQDYFTLRHEALRKGLDETGYDLRFLKLYQAFITGEQANKEIHAAMEVIEDIRKIYSRLIDAIGPMIRRGLPTAI